MIRRSMRRPRPLGSRRAAAALRYADLGWPVLPLHAPTPVGRCSCGRPDCPKPGKHPRSRRGRTDATISAAQVAAWWGAWPDANVGVATGRLLVLDVDGDRGHASLAELEENDRHGMLDHDGEPRADKAPSRYPASATRARRRRG